MNGIDALQPDQQRGSGWTGRRVSQLHSRLDIASRPGDVTTVEWARAYAAMGWHVFPVVPHGKRPMFRGWQRDATTTPALIARYWHSEPGPNLGVITGEAFVAYDIEAVHLAAFRNWMKHGGLQLPETPIARTGRGGIHILVRGQAHSASGRDLVLGGVHIGERKGVGGFIVVCPSRTEGVYGWHRSPLDFPVGEPPAWLEHLAAPPRTSGRRFPVLIRSVPEGRRRLGALADAVRGARPGHRNAVLYWAARRAREEGVPERYAKVVLLRAACDAGLSEREAMSTLKSGFDASEAGRGEP